MKHQHVVQPDTLRDALRAQTDTAHQRMHSHSAFVALFAGSIGLTDYTALMRKFHGFYGALDTAVADVTGQSSCDYSYARRGDILAQDLVDLGLDVRDVQANPQCLALHDVVTPASLGGVLYVIEGATLGAAQIDRAAQKILSPTRATGRNFWASSRAQGKMRWAAMTRMLQELDAQNHPRAPLIQGATGTFQALADWLAPLDKPLAVGALR